MAARNYATGTVGKISVSIQVGSAAGWTGAVFKVVPGVDSSEYPTLAQSTIEDNAATFPSTPIGNAIELKGHQVILEVIADFRNVTGLDVTTFKTDPQALRNALFIDFTINGGTDGQQDFDYDSDDITLSTDDEIVAINKFITFK